MRQSNGRSITARKAAMYAAAAAVMLTVTLAPGRLLEGAPQQPSWKGIWEPVNYKGDVQFKDVLFVTADKGWVSGNGKPGSGGVIMHTKDAGKTWSTQFGDPESSDRPIDDLFFLDERRGWARQHTTLLHTTDGETWEAVGTVRADANFVFVSPTIGFMAEGEELKRTEDGGQSWATTGKCGAPVVIEGLTKNESCDVRSIHFPSRNVGYAVGAGYEKFVYLMKTTDGGRSWTNSAFPAESGGGHDVFFTDEHRGFVRTHNRPMYGTEDGGNTWKRIAGSPIGNFRFADPVVGWSMEYKEMLYTTNGGRAWTQREIAFPAFVSAMSLPRRDRGYVVGEHGMIYRYSVVKVSQQAPGAIAAPLMPTFETLLDEKVEALDDFVESLEESIAKMPDDAGGNSGNPESSSTSASDNSGSGSTSGSESSGSTDAASGSDEVLFSESTDATTSGSGSTDVATSPIGSIGVTSESPTATPTSPFVEKCCGKSVSRWYLAMQAAESILPQFVAQFKNTNLLGAGLRMLVVLPARVNAASAAFSTFKRSKSKDDAKANVTQLQAAVDALKQGVSSALQKEVPST